jgi:hypothetical protein
MAIRSDPYLEAFVLAFGCLIEKWVVFCFGWDRVRALLKSSIKSFLKRYRYLHLGEFLTIKKPPNREA